MIIRINMTFLCKADALSNPSVEDPLAEFFFGDVVEVAETLTEQLLKLVRVSGPGLLLDQYRGIRNMAQFITQQ